MRKEKDLSICRVQRSNLFETGVTFNMWMRKRCVNLSLGHVWIFSYVFIIILIYMLFVFQIHTIVRYRKMRLYKLFKMRHNFNVRKIGWIGDRECELMIIGWPARILKISRKKINNIINCWKISAVQIEYTIDWLNRPIFFTIT